MCTFTHNNIQKYSATNIYALFYYAAVSSLTPLPVDPCVEVRSQEFCVYFVGVYLGGHNFHEERSLCNTICEM